MAALELALSLTFLVPLMMGMLDFGYYFYIGTNAEEAARASVRALVNAGTAVCGTPGANQRAGDEHDRRVRRPRPRLHRAARPTAT